MAEKGKSRAGDDFKSLSAVVEVNNANVHGVQKRENRVQVTIFRVSVQ